MVKTATLSPQNDLRDTARQVQAQQTARESNRPTPVARKADVGVTGQRLIRTIGPGNLLPDAKTICIKAGAAVYCGRMTGIAYSVRRHPNSKDTTKESLCFAGKFLTVLASGEVIQSLEMYVPSVVQGAFAGMLESRAAVEVRFALEIWAEPDEVSGRKTAQGYTYVAHDLMPTQAHDPLLELAAAAGVIEPVTAPLARLAAPQGGYDPDTGEVQPGA